MDSKKIMSLLKRIGLGLVVTGTTLYATAGCDTLQSLQDLVKGIVSGASA